MVGAKEKKNVAFTFATTASPPKRMGRYTGPVPKKKKTAKEIATMTMAEKIKQETRTENRREKRSAVERNVRMLQNISLIRLMIKKATATRPGYFYPLPLELKHDALPPRMEIAIDPRGFEVVEETFPDGSVVRYRIYSQKTGVNPASRSLSGLSRLVSFYRVGDKILVNESHTLWITPDNDFFSLWRHYVMDDEHEVLYDLKNPTEKRGRPGYAPLGHMVSVVSMTDYFMNTYGMSHKEATQVAREIKKKTTTT